MAARGTSIAYSLAHGPPFNSRHLLKDHRMKLLWIAVGVAIGVVVGMHCGKESSSLEPLEAEGDTTPTNAPGSSQTS